MDIHTMTFISPNAVISDSVAIKPFASIGSNVTICKGTTISESCVINDAEIGEGTYLQPGVKVGSNALGALKDASGKWHDRPHFGRVVIGSNVRIEDNTVINRGYLKNTVISNNVRI